jgi:hypothetical protein
MKLNVTPSCRSSNANQQFFVKSRNKYSIFQIKPFRSDKTVEPVDARKDANFMLLTSRSLFLTEIQNLGSRRKVHDAACKNYSNSHFAAVHRLPRLPQFLCFLLSLLNLDCSPLCQLFVLAGEDLLP